MNTENTSPDEDRQANNPKKPKPPKEQKPKPPPPEFLRGVARGVLCKAPDFREFTKMSPRTFNGLVDAGLELFDLGTHELWLITDDLFELARRRKIERGRSQDEVEDSNQ